MLCCQTQPVPTIFEIISFSSKQKFIDKQFFKSVTNVSDSDLKMLNQMNENLTKCQVGQRFT